MKKNYCYVVPVLIALGLSACGPAPAPTFSVTDIQNTANAEAWFAVTLTQAAIPTATLTFTPVPPTSTPLPTLPPALPSIAPAAPATDPCNDIPPLHPQGDLVKVKLVNKSGGSVNLSLGMTKENSFHECGTYSFGLGAYDESVVTVLAGCYWGYAWVSGKKPSTAQTIDVLCVTDPANVAPIWIGTEVIAFP